MLCCTVYICYADFVKVLILYRPDSEHANEVETFVEDFQRQHLAVRKVELLSLNTREGSSMASLYDVMSYPAILVLADDGSLVNSWSGLPLPLMDEIAGYAYS